MSVVLESRMLRDFLHRLVDNLVNELETTRTARAVSPILSVTQPETTKPRITLEPPARKTPTAKPEPPTPRKFPDVTVACRSSCGRLEIAVSLSAEVAKRLDVRTRGKVAIVLRAGKLRIHRSIDGRTLFSGGATGRLWFATIADFFGVTEKHAAESCAFHYDLQDALLIEPPAWLKVAKPLSVKPPSEKPKDGAPMSCKKMAGTNPTIKCAACQKATATVECSRCPTLLCDDCWDPHVRKHWHTAVTSKPPVGHVADLKG
jgi:hypothetical protein